MESQIRKMCKQAVLVHNPPQTQLPLDFTL